MRTETTGIAAGESVVKSWRVKSNKGYFLHSVTDNGRHYIWGPENTHWEMVEIIPAGWQGMGAREMTR